MPNLINLNVVYDSSGLLTGLNDIDLICSTSTENKKISSSIYDISADPPLKVPNQIDQNTKILTKIEDCNGSYYLVSDSYGKISDAQESNCEFCQTEPSPGGPEVDPVFSASPAHNITDGDITFLQQKDYNNLNNLPDLSLKADLVSGKVPASQLPSYVDDVIEGANLSAFPDPGEAGKIYVALDTNKAYRWSGSTYAEISTSVVDDNLTRLSRIQNVTYTQDTTNYYIRGQVLHINKNNGAFNFSPGSLTIYLNGNLQTGTGIALGRETSPDPLLSSTDQLKDMNNASATGAYAFIPFVITIPKATNTSTFWSSGNGYISFVLNYSSFIAGGNISTPMHVMRAQFSSPVYNPTLYPKVSMIDYDQDATNYILRVVVSNMTTLNFASVPFDISIHSAGLIANNIATTFDGVNGYAGTTIPTGQIGGYMFIVTIPKANNTSPAWNNDIVAMTITWKGTDGIDGASASPYNPRRFASDTNLIGVIRKKSIIPARYGTDYSKEWNGSVTTASSTAIFNISAAAFTTITNVTVGTELVGATIDNAPIGVITARSLTSITVSLYESKNTTVLVGGSVDGLENHAVANTIVYLTVKGT